MQDVESEPEENEAALAAKRAAILARFSSAGRPPLAAGIPPRAAAAIAGQSGGFARHSSPALSSACPSPAPSLSEGDREDAGVDTPTEAVLLGKAAEAPPAAAGIDELDDMFSDTPVHASAPQPAAVTAAPEFDAEADANADNWDDGEGYFITRIGEVLGRRYKCREAIGKGVYSTVLRALDMETGSLVAIKLVRNNETMYRAGLKEIQILKDLAASDPELKRHCVRLLSHFEYKHHLCMVFEPLMMNLRELVERFGPGVGISAQAVRVYAQQLFVALRHQKACRVVHGDIKLDNVLVNQSHNSVRICDYGTADFIQDCEVTPMLVSRYYRAPEIILGLQYEYGIDLWSTGCCLFELYTGKFLFPGGNNNDMLRLHMEYKGHFSRRVLRKGAFRGEHFEEDSNTFRFYTSDTVTKKDIVQLISYPRATKSLLSALSAAAGEDPPRQVQQLADLLEKIFVLDPGKRISVEQALKHPFIRGE